MQIHHIGHGIRGFYRPLGSQGAPFTAGKKSFELQGGTPQPSYFMSPSPEGNANPIGQRK
ncbi:MAG: hypothetical protein DRG31_06155 [Deltaproteobacteria bacterium]|nr:MAG: hypothetical protein DRG31_06155 [Deltaproteobacteria bacterium]